MFQKIYYPFHILSIPHNNNMDTEGREKVFCHQKDHSWRVVSSDFLDNFFCFINSCKTNIVLKQEKLHSPGLKCLWSKIFVEMHCSCLEGNRVAEKDRCRKIRKEIVGVRLYPNKTCSIYCRANDWLERPSLTMNQSHFAL